MRMMNTMIPMRRTRMNSFRTTKMRRKPPLLSNSPRKTRRESDVGSPCRRSSRARGL